MTEATKVLIDKLSEIVDRNKYIILSGGSATGKTFLALEIAKRCAAPQYNDQGALPSGKLCYSISLELVPIHDSFTYEDFISGIEITTVNGHIDFQYKDKIFLSLIKKANKSWMIQDDKKFFLILDNIERGSISGILGDALPLIEPHAYKKNDIAIANKKIWITPNIYIIATRNTTINSFEQFNYGLFRHFYEYELENDFKYMSDTASSVFSEFDISANAMFYRSKKIVMDHLKHRYSLPVTEREKFNIGHGIYNDYGISMRMKYQVIPLLKQYLKDGVLERTAKIEIDALDGLIGGKYSKDFTSAELNRIIPFKKDITSTRFLNEKTTHQPMVNLVTRIKEQGLLDDTDIANTILFNPQVLIRKKAKINGKERFFNSPGYLYIRKLDRDIYTYGTTVDSNGKPKRPRFFYSGSAEDCIKVDNIDYSVASEMQPNEYTRWYEDLDSGNEDNERYSSSPNSIMFRILRSYYKVLAQRYEDYLLDYPNDENINNLKVFVQEEYKLLVNETKKLHPEISDERDVNSKANDDFRKVISSLVLFWKNRGEIINVGGRIIKVEGVYKVNNKNRYDEYSKAMNMLGIHQMIMQGPPGTSKTYCAREYLKYLGINSETQSSLNDDELDDLQIQDYAQGGDLCKWTIKNPGKAPVIAWDIVQFHPSYGYEDFVRGIEVRTIKTNNNTASAISYETVNKVLGRMAEVAARKEYENTKFYLIIDEINRANLATVFGELIYGLEYRERSVSTPYTVDKSNKVKLPENLYIIGTMNTADKSIGGIDYAIRRRFLFFSLLPNRDVILKFNKNGIEDELSEQDIINQKAVKLFDRVSELFNSENLNSEYYKDDIQIGHTYFLVTDEEQLFLRFRYQVIPILKEYYKDGMFQLEKPEKYNDGWSGLVGCIIGDIDINADEDKVKNVFNQLITSA